MPVHAMEYRSPVLRLTKYSLEPTANIPPTSEKLIDDETAVETGATIPLSAENGSDCRAEPPLA